MLLARSLVVRIYCAPLFYLKRRVRAREEREKKYQWKKTGNGQTKKTNSGSRGLWKILPLVATSFFGVVLRIRRGTKWDAIKYYQRRAGVVLFSVFEFV